MARNLKSKDALLGLEAYELVKSEVLEDLNSYGYLLHHKKTGARIVVVSNDDTNKVFSIGFRTPPTNSTGVPHIIEHSVLCGSKNFPAKDPFIELAKGSLNTFLNAMTYPDKTVYPVASCNEQDFQNLMHVYMDAVFYPNIYKREEIFMQEGWHYELEDETSELIYNGVVYNEMKGAFSSPESVLLRSIQNSLYPDTTYSVESGGDPENIPDLSYEEFLEFHKKYYHPSNSYVYIYGDMDVEEKLNWMDQEYFSEFEPLHVDSIIKEQIPFSETRVEEKYYPITETEDSTDKTYLSYNFSIGSSLDQELCIAFQILQTVLLDAPGAPLKQALIDAGIGKDIYGGFDWEIKQPMLTIVAKNTEADRLDEFMKVIRTTIKGLVENGLDEKSVKAAINLFEFQYKEADFGRFPKGLMYGLHLLSTWLYDDKDAFGCLHASKVIEQLKEKMTKGYFEELLRKFVLENTHASIVVLKPEAGLNSKRDEVLKKKLADYKAGLSKEELTKIIEATHHLRKYQEEPSTKEELEAIPLLKREDIKKEAMPLYNKERRIDGVKLLHHDVFTNGISYLKLMFDVSKCPTELTPYLGLLSTVLGYMNTENKSFLEFSNDVNICTGGMSTNVVAFGKKGSSVEYTPMFYIETKVLNDKISSAFALIKEMLTESKLEDTKRLQEILLETKSRLQMRMVSNGNTTAMERAISYYSPQANFEQQIRGIAYYKFIEDLVANFEDKKENIVTSLEKLMKYVFQKENLLISVTSKEEGVAIVEQEIQDFCNCLFVSNIDASKKEMKLQGKNEGFKTSSQVQYVATAGNFFEAGYEYTGALRVLRTIMGYEYLWNNIRVKGGAYGCMCNFSGLDGNGYFVSYRDPNLRATTEVYKRASEYVRLFEANEREMTKYIIGTMSTLDTPLPPSSVGSRSLNAYLSETAFEQIQKERDEILGVTVEKIRELSNIVKAIVDANHFCVVGNDQKIEEDKDLFDNVMTLV